MKINEYLHKLEKLNKNQIIEYLVVRDFETRMLISFAIAGIIGVVFGISLDKFFNIVWYLSFIGFLLVGGLVFFTLFSFLKIRKDSIIKKRKNKYKKMNKKQLFKYLEQTIWAAVHSNFPSFGFYKQYRMLDKKFGIEL